MVELSVKSPSENRQQESKPFPNTQAMDECQVLLVDDNDAFRQSTVWLFESAKFKVVDFSSADSLLSALSENLCPAKNCCVVADYKMPEMNGIELMQELKKRQLDLPVVMISGYGDIPLAVQATKTGIYDFIEKPFTDATLIDTVRQAIKENKRKTTFIDFEVLTPRENQVLKAMSTGERTKIIADKLFISARTVEYHRANILKKLKVKSIQELYYLLLGSEWIAKEGFFTNNKSK